MNKNILIFIITFLVGAMIALAIRTARHDPYEVNETAPAASVHHHDESATSDAAKPVNTVCPICGMDVDPVVSTALYQGKVVGFGCKACPAKFAADPEAYGPAALVNEVVE